MFRITVRGLKRYKHRYHYKCVVIPCACRFSTVRDWNNHHRNFHKTTLRCSDCCKGFRTPSACRDHVYMHKQQQFTCRKCNKKFCFPSSLQVHVISHLKSRLHKCFAAGCKKVYKYKQDLLQHIKQHECMSYECDQCDYSSSEKRLLKWHMVQHSEKKLFRCTKCSKKYKHYNSLNRHSKKCLK